MLLISGIKNGIFQTTQESYNNHHINIVFRVDNSSDDMGYGFLAGKII